jgi:hypothetical protein
MEMKQTLRNDQTGGGPNSTSTRSSMTVPAAQVHGKWDRQGGGTRELEGRLPDRTVSPSDATPAFITDSEIRSFAQVSIRLDRLEGKQSAPPAPTTQRNLKNLASPSNIRLDSTATRSSDRRPQPALVGLEMGHSNPPEQGPSLSRKS